MVHLTVNGKEVEVPEDSTVLQAVRAAGVELPTLCHHDALTPYGACRLCMVAIEKPHRALVASCAYPVEEGMEVSTDDPEAVAARRLVLELLLSRCPQSDFLRELAAKEGVIQSRFGPPPPERAEELCLLCGLCVRVCQEVIGASAIGFIGRGMERKVGTPFNVQAESCLGCGACAEICPTGAIRIEDRGDERILHTWNTVVKLRACAECGRYFAPEPLEFVQERFPELKGLWELCPDCRRKRTIGQWVEIARGGA